jgi:3-hydroxybutyryl-CoA dehydratase
VSLDPGAELVPVVKELTQEKINRYAVAGGDGNPLHTDPEFAARTQFGGTIAHGMLLLAYLSEMLTAAFGEAWLSGGRLKVRFKAPARPGDTVSAVGQVIRVEGGRTVCEVECRNQHGAVLVGGEAACPRTGVRLGSAGEVAP